MIMSTTCYTECLYGTLTYHKTNLLTKSARYSSANTAYGSFRHVLTVLVKHFQNQTQACRDNKGTEGLNNASFYVGVEQPTDAVPYISVSCHTCLVNLYRLGIFYPQSSTVGGSSQSNAMNFALPPDENWKNITKLTRDKSWLTSCGYVQVLSKS